MPEQFEFLVLNAPERLRKQGTPGGPGLFGVRWDAARPEFAADAECAIIGAAGRKRTKELLKLARAQFAARICWKSQQPMRLPWPAIWASMA